jgi:hypothetical protein
MPKGPQGQKRPADVIGTAVMVAKIATGEIEDTISPMHKRAAGGNAGGKARADKLTADQRQEIAWKAARSRWNKKKTPHTDH